MGLGVVPRALHETRAEENLHTVREMRLRTNVVITPAPGQSVYTNGEGALVSQNGMSV